MQDNTAHTDIDDESTEKVASPETLSVWGLAWPSIIAVSYTHLTLPTILLV